MAVRPSIVKRQKEQARKDKNKEKAERRAQRQAEKGSSAPSADGEDPDIAGIIPGPQPKPDDEGDGPAT